MGPHYTLHLHASVKIKNDITFGARNSCKTYHHLNLAKRLQIPVT